AQQQPPLPPPGTIGSQRVGARVPQLGERIDAAQTDRMSRLQHTLSSQSETPFNLLPDETFVFSVPDRGAHLRNARPIQQQPEQTAAQSSLIDAARQFIAYWTTPSQQTDQQEASRRRRAAQQVDRILAAQPQAQQEANRILAAQQEAERLYAAQQAAQRQAAQRTAQPQVFPISSAS
ncbi:MAG: hypothetical protein ACKPKO_25675, partial [Candidatus Fonsibacter sp.]